MKVRCINDKGSKFLLKGHVYDVFWAGTTQINVVGVRTSQRKDRFETLDGTQIPSNFRDTSKNPWRSAPLRELVLSDKVIGEKVKCRRTNLKSVNFDKEYVVEKTIGTGYGKKLKLKGVTRALSWYSFELVPKDIQRDDALNDILGIESERDIQKKKFPVKVLLKFLEEHQKMANLIEKAGYDKSVEDFMIEKKVFNKELIDQVKELKIGDIL